MIRDLHDVLAEQRFFADFNSSEIQFLVSCSTNRVYQPGEFLFREAEPAADFFLIREGKVALELVAPSAGSLTLQTVGRGDVIGWSWIVPPYVHRLDARAIEQTRVVTLDAGCLRDKLESDHELGYRLLKQFVGVIAQRLESSRVQLIDLYGKAND